MLAMVTISDVDRNVSLSSVGFGFGPSLVMVVRDQGGDFWDKDGDFPYPLGDFPTAILLDLGLNFDGGFG